MQKMKFKNSFDDRLSGKGWLISEDSWDSKLQSVYETRFTLGNGDICCRGVLEELPYDSYAGTYMAGLYDRTGAQITELVNLPNPLQFKLDAYGEKLDPVATDTISHKRILDMYSGVLYRHTIYKTTHKKRLDYTSRRFVSMMDKNIIAMEIELTPLDADMTIDMQTMIDTGVMNRGTITEGRKRHFQTIDASVNKDYTYLCVETFEKKTLIAYASILELTRNNKYKVIGDRASKLRIKKGHTARFRKLISIISSNNCAPAKMKKKALSAIRAAHKKGFQKLLSEHNEAWRDKWDICNVRIDGDREAEKALRFNMYHLIISGSETNADASVGARTLSGEGYRGHVFWDTEIFILPFFIYTNPKIAKNLLMYRYRRLDAAKHIASAKGYKGALFPWESADTGEECTPSWAKNFDGSIVKIVTMDEEHHISSDVAYAFAHYCRATGDKNFMFRFAMEVVFETARFWKTRTVLNKKKKTYEIHHAMGPDEFHENVNNNAYTNAMAAWNLKKAYTWYYLAKKEKNKVLNAISKRIKLTEREVNEWKKISEKMYIPYSKKKNLIEPFDGFFKLKNYRITRLNERLMPELPSVISWDEVGKTQFIKQADIVMLLYLLSDRFSSAVKKKNYYFNERKTLHSSSLSAPIHSIMGLEVGDEDKALHYFATALSSDLSNTHGNTDEGIHAAASGGAWQATIMGFAGMRPAEKEIIFNPHMPDHWKTIKFKMYWQGALISVSINHTKTEIELIRKYRRRRVYANVYGISLELKTHTTITFRKKERTAKRR